jgi:hypothetical protein
MAIAAGMNMRTASAGTLIPPSTPPPPSAMPNARLRRSPAREHLKTTYEFDEDLHMSQAEGMPLGPPALPALPFGSSTSTPSTPAGSGLHTPARNVPRTPGSLGFRSVCTSQDPDTTGGGVRLPRSLGADSWTLDTPTNVRNRDVGVIGDGSPLRRNNSTAAGRGGLLGAAAASASSASSSPLSLTQLYTTTEVTAREHARRMAMHRERMLRRNTIDEEDDDDDD